MSLHYAFLWATIIVESQQAHEFALCIFVSNHYCGESASTWVCSMHYGEQPLLWRVSKHTSLQYALLWATIIVESQQAHKFGRIHFCLEKVSICLRFRSVIHLLYVCSHATYWLKVYNHCVHCCHCVQNERAFYKLVSGYYCLCVCVCVCVLDSSESNQ